VTVGQPAVLMIRMANQTGPRPEKLTLRVRLPEGLQHEKGHEIEGEVSVAVARSINLKVTAVRAGRHTVEVVVTAPDGAHAQAMASVLVIEPQAPAATAAVPSRKAVGLVVRKLGEKLPIQGETKDYRIEVVNVGLTDVPGVTVYDRLPEGLAFVSAGNGATYDAAARTVEWKVGTLAANQRQEMVLTVMALTPGEQFVEVWALGEQGQEARLKGSMQVRPR
jgi:uncharacterized repeat protein (TIGR01451 family)